MFYKDTDGGLRWITRYSNNFRDDEKEIIAEASHKRFVDLVDKGLAPYPELLIWHEKSWKIGVADWVAYDDSGYALASGTVDKDAEETAVWLSKQKDIRTSHGMPIVTIKRDEEDPLVIVEHESREISVLPKSRAANKLTGWYVIEKELQEEKIMAIPKAKKDKLIKDWDIKESVLDGLEKYNEVEAKAANDEGLASKEIDVDEEDIEGEDAAEKDSKEDETKEEDSLSRKEIVEVFEVVIKSLSEQMAVQFKEVHARIDAVGEDVEKEVNKKLTETPSASIAGMLSKKLSITGSSDLADIKVDGRTALANSGPNETKEETKEHTGIPFVDKMLSQEGEKKNE